MAARAKVQAQQGKGREITGICLLGFGIFCALSLGSMHAGSGSMMGPGGRATAVGLYSLAGVTAYVLVAALLVIAVRVFRGRPMARSLGEWMGVAGVLAGSTMLLHLPFAGEPVTMQGPGGLLGQWLGEIAASFVGTVGAALAGATLLSIALMVLTNVRPSEVTAVVGAALSQVGAALAEAGRSLGRVVVAMFPEKSDRDLLDAASNPFEEMEEDEVTEASQLSEVDDTLTMSPEELPEIRGVFDRTLRGMPAAPAPRAALPAVDSEPVRVGRSVRPLVIERDNDDLRLQLPELDDEPSFLGSDLHGDFEEASQAFQAAHSNGHDAADASLPGSLEDSFMGSLNDGSEIISLAQHRPRQDVRRPLSAVVAEVAAIECAAEVPRQAAAAVVAAASLVERAAEPTIAPVIVTPSRPAGPRPGAPPIIVEPEAPVREPAQLSLPKETGPGFIRLSEGDFKLPSVDLLEYVPPPAQEIDKQGLYDMAGRLEQAMSNYGVKGNVSAINMGPVVTMYEFAPAPGTRTGKIAQLENDLAMALEAQAVRIVAPIPGKAVVGVEVPNKNRQTVYLKEILADDTFHAAGSKLQIALGKDIKGNPVTVNLSKMPHLLVAGTTGSGKSVTVNGMITSILYNATPEEARFIMVDPKMLELSIYEGIPHLLLPVVTDPKKANLALRWAVDEMERRYELLAKTGVRDISSYNAKVEVELARREGKAASKAEARNEGSGAKRLKVVLAGADGAEQELPLEHADTVAAGVITEEMREEISNQKAAAQHAKEQAGVEEPLRKLPFIVIVIDEFADLMMVAPKDVETSVARLAQKARAAGLHLILATQRPSVDVITGLIKANFPSRIALQVASKIDSRTILDQPGAETLLGNGDMLFSDRGTKLRRIHGAFLSDDEVHRVVDSLKAQAKPVYDMDILKPRDEEGEEGGAPVDDFHDALYDQAVAIVCETRQASVSFIQRRLQIGYNRSARMVEQMERDGIVGPANGIKPREVLAPAGEYLNHAS